MLKVDLFENCGVMGGGGGGVFRILLDKFVNFSLAGGDVGVDCIFFDYFVDFSLAGVGRGVDCILFDEFIDFSLAGDGGGVFRSIFFYQLVDLVVLIKIGEFDNLIGSGGNFAR